MSPNTFSGFPFWELNHVMFENYGTRFKGSNF